MLPVAVLPAGAIIVGIGNLLKALNILPTVALFFSTVGSAILGQLGLIFAIGVAIGMAMKNDGAVALAGALGYALVVKVLSPEFVAPLFNIKESAVNDGFSKMDNSNVFIGIIIGLIAAYCYNKFSDVELPTALSFFSGKRLVPIMTVFYCTFLIVILLFAWPFIYSAIVAFFVAPVLFVIHALLTGLSLFIAALFHWTAGFSFSAGLIDYALSLINPVANHPLMILVQGIVFFALYYFIFRFVIKIFNLNTIGRGDNLLADPTSNTTERDGAETTSKSKYHHTASQILEGLGGSENITTLTNCATRLRMELKDNSIIDEQKIRNAGAVGVTKNGQHSAQVIIGTHVQQVADEIEKQM